MGTTSTAPDRRQARARKFDLGPDCIVIHFTATTTTTPATGVTATLYVGFDAEGEGVLKLVELSDCLLENLPVERQGQGKDQS